MTQVELQFDGKTFDKKLDGKRLSGQLHLVFNLMADGRWRALSEIAFEVDGSEAGVSARLRDLRKRKFGSHEVNRRRRGNAKRGVWEYQLIRKA